MQNKWRMLIVIIFMYLPVSLDATVLYVVAPVLSTDLRATHNELLWIMDIYPLVMAALLIPMGLLGDRLGFIKMAMTGSAIFGLASLAAACSETPLALICARALLASGAAMIVPATLAAVRTHFPDEKERNLALGIWTTIGTAGALAGPLMGGMLLEHFHWGSVFLINIPAVVVVIILLRKVVTNAQAKRSASLNLRQALLLMTSLLLLVYALKSFALPGPATGLHISFLAIGLGLLGCFITLQIISTTPLLDTDLLKQRNIIAGVFLALIAMITLVGFELLLSQELQLVHRFSPGEAGLYILPMMLASCLAGPVVGILINRLGIITVAMVGLAASALSLYALSGVDFAHEILQAKGWMFLLGAGETSALMASSSAIMTAAPVHKASTAGSFECVSYELGTGLGITLFGTVLAGIYSSTVQLPENLSAPVFSGAGTSFSEAISLSQQLAEPTRTALVNAASSAFMHSHSVTLQLASLIMAVLMVLTFFIFKRGNVINHG
ncbi:MFS transporter [Lelliottia amnigena]|nr:MFS transporter [Lelliottia amnigena]